MVRAYSAVRRRRRLPVRAAMLGDLTRHLAGFEKRVGIDVALNGPRGGGHARQLVVRVLRAFQAPGALAFLQQPQPGDILQQPDLAADADLVRVIQLQRLLVDDRLVESRRPSATTCPS